MSAVRRRVFLDTQDGRDKVVIESTQDYGEILAANKRAMAAEGSGTSSFWKGREYVRIATIPNILIEQWMKMGLSFYNPDDWKILKRLINDSEYSHLRTAPGRF